MKNQPHNHFLLSHHHDAEAHHCLVACWRRHQYLVCARCAGAIAGIAIAAVFLTIAPALLPSWVTLLALPDWLLVAAGVWRGHNAVRLASGALLGALYLLNLYHLVLGEFPLGLWATNVTMVLGYLLGLHLVRTRWARERSGRAAGRCGSTTCSRVAAMRR